MAQAAIIDLRSSHRQEADGTHTVTVTISGMPTLEWAQRVSDWMRGLVRANADQIGWLERNPPKEN